MLADPDPDRAGDQVTLVVRVVQPQVAEPAWPFSASYMTSKYGSGRGVKWSRSAVSTYSAWNAFRSCACPDR